ncbi:Abi family protein [uncultured Slackia sp.]|uniref:Abi family protein n=1 Tax=uncultured Slackia sp. TaxID=665903 RepID=UPI002675BE01|nr:Abi family protein [uncultured Slackia sp.]
MGTLPAERKGRFNGDAEDEQAPSALPWAEKWLSAERLTPYLKACGGDAEKALALYEWNSSLAQLLMRDISNFEVALRNACNAAMESSWQGDAHWLLDENSPARRPVMRKSARGMLDSNRINRRTIDAAVDGLPKGFSTGNLVAGLTLGFWVHLSDRSREAVIWRSGLYRAWPKGTNRAELQERLYGILRVRNRVAHNERLFDPKRPELSPKKVDTDAIELLGILCPEATDYLYGEGGAPIGKFLNEHPAPVAVEL